MPRCPRTELDAVASLAGLMIVVQTDDIRLRRGFSCSRPLRRARRGLRQQFHKFRLLIYRSLGVVWTSCKAGTYDQWLAFVQIAGTDGWLAKWTTRRAVAIS